MSDPDDRPLKEFGTDGEGLKCEGAGWGHLLEANHGSLHPMVADMFKTNPKHKGAQVMRREPL